MRRLLCRVFGHAWKHTMSVGDAREYLCTRCRERKVIVNGVTLSPEDSAEKSAEMWEGARAVMWMLDNVEPDYTTGRDPE
ncbi:DUF1660 family phage protein [Arthrobacter sp. R4]|uniref:DUF1660 family phage protein n=1 Tax=Arthrobacter sp. R4 TaxID=644417 RepID=UPI003EDB5FE3